MSETEIDIDEEPFDRDATLIEGSVNVNIHRHVRNIHPEEEERRNKQFCESNELRKALWQIEQTWDRSALEFKMNIIHLPDPAEVTEYMRCSKCSKLVEPPGYFCTEGHLICEKDLLFSAPTCPYVLNGSQCNRPFLSARPLFYEVIFKNSFFKCVNACRGCSEVILRQKKKDHEANCEFRESKRIALSPKPEVRGKSTEGKKDAEEKLAKEKKVGRTGPSYSKTSNEGHSTYEDFGGRHSDQMPDFRFNDEDMAFVVTNLIQNIPEYKWVGVIPAMRRDGISLEVADREIDRVKFILKRHEEKKKAGKGVPIKKKVVFVDR